MLSGTSRIAFAFARFLFGGCRTYFQGRFTGKTGKIINSFLQIFDAAHDVFELFSLAVACGGG